MTSASVPPPPSAVRATRRTSTRSRPTRSSTRASTRRPSARPTRAALLTGPQPPLGRDGRHHRDRDLRPRLHLDAAEHDGAAGRDAQAERLLDGPVREVPRGPGLGDQPDGPVRQLAGWRRRLRVLLRLHRRRGQPVEPGAVRRADAGRADRRRPRRATTSPRTWPTTPSAGCASRRR